METDEEHPILVIATRVAKRGVESSERLDKHRLAEKALEWFADFGKLRICLERQLDIHGKGPEDAKSPAR